MQLRNHVSRTRARVAARLQANRVSASVVSLLALCAACSSEYPVGDLRDQSLPVGLGPDGASEGAATAIDQTLEPLLAPPDVTLAGRPAFQLSPVGVGDIDGDGYADFAVTGFDEALLINYVHLRYGGPAPIAPEDQFALAESGARLALEENSPPIESVGPAGDLNGDGFADMIVTTTVCDGDLAPGAGAYVLYGGPERLEGVVRIGGVATHLTLPIERSNDQEPCGTASGAPLGLGDIDGDGLDDFMLVSYRAPDAVDPERIDYPTYTTGHVFYGSEERLASGLSWFDADATINAEHFFTPQPVGDVTADGIADFAIGAELAGYYWVPGSAQRLSGEVAAADTFAGLACSDELCATPPVARAGDVDGDGVDDVIAYQNELIEGLLVQRAHLFYGAPGLLDGGELDFEQAAASFIDDQAVPRERLLTPAGDRDGDGDADLLSLFFTDTDLLHSDVAFVSGSSARLEGPQTLPIQDAIATRPDGLPFALVIEHQDVTFPQDRAIFTATNAGDLNGDGADDLLTSSMYLMRADETGTSWGSPQLHIHYGTPGGVAPVSSPR
jgi:hypothetical protein